MVGFLAGQAVKDGGALNAGLCTFVSLSESMKEKLLNMIILVDQEFALKWVQNNVRFSLVRASIYLLNHYIIP